MITREMRSYDFYTYGAPDQYAQQTLSKDVKGSIKIAIYTSSQSVQDNINYKDCAYIGFTYDRTINNSFVIKYGEEKLKVLYTNPVGRYNLVFLKKI